MITYSGVYRLIPLSVKETDYIKIEIKFRINLMKKQILLFALFASFTLCYSRNLEITPILLNFKGVVVSNNITVAFADFGSALISRDNEMTWEQKRIFIGGEIVNVFIESNDMIAFNDRGEVAVSSDSGNSWTIQKKLEDSVLSVVKYSEGYFLRMRNKLITLSNQFEKMNEFEIESKVLTQIGKYYKPNYTKSILNVGNKLIAEFDSSIFIRFDLNMKPIDTLKLQEQIKLGDYLCGYRMFYDSNFIYIKYSYKNLKGVMYSSIFRTNDFKNVEKLADSLTPENYYSIFKGKIYSLSVGNNKKLTDTTKLSSNQINLYFKESTVFNNKQYILGDRKILEILDLKDSSLKVISDYSDISLEIPPDLINNKSYLFYSSTSRIYKSENNGTTILPTIDKSYPSYQQHFDIFNIRNHYYDNELNKLYLFGDPYVTNQGVIWVSNDEGKTFDSTFMERVYYSASPFYRNASLVKNNIQKRGDDFIFSDGYTLSPQKVVYSSIKTIKENGKFVRMVQDSNLTFNYIYSKDTNSYLVQSCNALDSTSQVIYSSNGGNSWNVIHKYPINETIGDVFDIEVKGRKYLALTHYDYTNYPILKGIYLDVVDKETQEFFRLASWGSKDDPQYGMYGVAVTSDGENAYFSFQDTLFVTNNLFNRKNWSYYLLPESGRIVKPLKKFGNKFYCIYTDRDNPYGNGMHWIEPLDSLISGVDEANARANEFIISPNPVTDFLSINSNIKIGKIEIFSTLGLKVLESEYKEKIDVSGLAPGVYFVRIGGKVCKFIKI